jgi:hypothetical protein
VYNNKCKEVKKMIKKLIKKLILKQCEIFEITPRELIQIDITTIIAVVIIVLSIRPFFGLVELLAKI